VANDRQEPIQDEAILYYFLINRFPYCWNALDFFNYLVYGAWLRYVGVYLVNSAYVLIASIDKVGEER
jgi:hypothetical protein